MKINQNLKIDGSSGIRILLIISEGERTKHTPFFKNFCSWLIFSLRARLRYTCSRSSSANSNKMGLNQRGQRCPLLPISSKFSCPIWQRHIFLCSLSPVQTQPLPPVAFALVAPWWCELGCCSESQTVVIFKLLRTSAFFPSLQPCNSDFFSCSFL